MNPFLLTCLFVLFLPCSMMAQTTPVMTPVGNTSTPVAIDPSIQELMKEHFRKGMSAFSQDDFGTALTELKEATSVKTHFDWQTWYPSAYKTLGVIYEFHSNDPQHKTLAYLYYSMAKEIDSDVSAEKGYMQQIPSSKKTAEQLKASGKPEKITVFFDDPDDSKPHWTPPPAPKADSRNLSFDIYSVYENASAGAELFSVADLFARRKLDDYSTTADLQVRFSKDLSSSDSANEVDLRLARISYVEPWIQLSVGRMDIFPVLTPMTFFGAYPDMGVHRVDGVMASIPIYFELGGKDSQSLPTALTVFYTPSLLEAADVDIDTEQSFFMAQARARIDFFGLQSLWSVNAAWTATDYFTYSSLNGNLSLSATGDITINNELSIYGELGDQNPSLFNSTDVLGCGLKVQKIHTWGAISLDEICLEMQDPFENDPNNVFSGGNPFNGALASNSTLCWYGSLKCRLQAISLTFAVTNNMDDFTLNRLNSSNSGLSAPVGPGRELEKSQIPLVAASYSQPAYLGSISVDF